MREQTEYAVTAEAIPHEYVSIRISTRRGRAGWWVRGSDFNGINDPTACYYDNGHKPIHGQIFILTHNGMSGTATIPLTKKSNCMDKTINAGEHEFQWLEARDV